MTVQELIDKLNDYIKKDPPDTWQLNDGDLDEIYYKERCQERANHEVRVIDTSVVKNFSAKVDSVTSHNVNNTKDVCALMFNGLLMRICR